MLDIEYYPFLQIGSLCERDHTPLTEGRKKLQPVQGILESTLTTNGWKSIRRKIINPYTLRISC